MRATASISVLALSAAKNHWFAKLPALSFSMI